MLAPLACLYVKKEALLSTQALYITAYRRGRGATLDESPLHCRAVLLGYRIWGNFKMDWKCFSLRKRWRWMIAMAFSESRCKRSGCRAKVKNYINSQFKGPRSALPDAQLLLVYTDFNSVMRHMYPIIGPDSQFNCRFCSKSATMSITNLEGWADVRGLAALAALFPRWLWERCCPGRSQFMCLNFRRTASTF